MGEIHQSQLGSRRKKKIRSDVTPNPGELRPQRPYAQRQTCAKQEQAQASTPEQIRTGPQVEQPRMDG